MTPHKKKRFISYIRVSTKKQGASGLGLEAQQASIANYINGSELVAEFVEIESGKRDERPELLGALKLCELTGATLIIAKLDRLSRNVEFTARLMNSGVEFIACDMPQANKFTVHIMSAVAEQEREAISQRTKAALQAAKARGVKLGTPENLTDEARKRGQEKATLIASAHAQMCAENVWGIIEQLFAEGPSLRGIARELNERGIKSARGGTWTATSVKNIIARGLHKRQSTSAGYS